MGKFSRALYEGLSVYVRQAAWLNTPTRNQKGETQPTRLERMRKARENEHYSPEMPPIHPAVRCLVTYLFEVGPVMAGGAGPMAITQGELRCWQDNTRIRLTPWQARTLRQLSRDYLTESVTAADSHAFPPWTSETEVAVQAAADDMRSAMRRLATKKD